VTNAKVKGKKVVAVNGSGTAYEVLRTYIQQHKPASLSTSQMGDLIEKAGLTRGAYSYGKERLLKERILKRGPKRKHVGAPQDYHVLVQNLGE
jgi:hypothetical protein